MAGHNVAISKDRDALAELIESRISSPVATGLPHSTNVCQSQATPPGAALRRVGGTSGVVFTESPRRVRRL
jgi:hypothetical protein